jgi:hypothetical protein
VLFQYSKKLIDETIQCFKDDDDLDISPEQANEYLNSFAGLYLAFADEHSAPSSLEAGGVPSVDNRGDSTLGVSNT